jgi:hypothetical protein
MSTNARDLTGLEFGHLTALRPTGKTGRYGVEWLVRCRCGNELSMVTADLTKKARRPGQMPRTCGCYRKRNRSKKYKGVGDLSGTKFRTIKAQAKHRGHEFGITIEYAWQLFVEQGRKCALTGLPLALSPSSMAPGTSTASLDRIDSDRGYIEGNVQWVHVAINYMKHTLPEEVFIQWCCHVAHYAYYGIAYGAELGKPPKGKKPYVY